MNPTTDIHHTGPETRLRAPEPVEHTPWLSDRPPAVRATEGPGTLDALRAALQTERALAEQRLELLRDGLYAAATSVERLDPAPVDAWRRRVARALHGESA